jgi:glycosyltransferase 2 family protein
MTTVEVGGRTVEIDAPQLSPWERGPGDVLRVVVGALLVLLTLAGLDFAGNTFAGVEADLASVADTVPSVFLLVLYALLAVVATLAPVVVLVLVVRRRNWRLLGLYVLTTTLANVVYLVVNGYISARVPEPLVTPDLPEWASQTVFEPRWAASFAAALVVSGPWLPRRWRQLFWAILFAVFPLRLLVGIDVPTGYLLGMAGGYLIGCVVVLAFGSPRRNPTAETVVRGLDASGVRLARLARAGVDARGSTPYFGEDVSGRRLFVKVLGIDERDADLMFRVYRWIRFSGLGDERPFSSLRRTVEHEALCSVVAERAGIVTPPLVTTVELPDRSMVLVYERIDGRSLDSVDPTEVTPEVLHGVWDQVALLRANRIAHRDLRRANVFLTADGRPMIIDFGFGEISASDLLLDQDVAQLVVSTAVDVGAERAVTTAIDVVGPDAVAAAAPRMQPLALAGATQEALKKQKTLLADVHAQVTEHTDLEEVQLAKLERVSPKMVLYAAVLFMAVWFIIPQFTELPRIMTQIKDANWVWAAPAIVFSMLTYVGAAMALSSSVNERLSVAKTTLVTLGGSFVNRITPAKVGGIALNLRYLQKQGVDTAVATASIGLYQLVGFLTHISLLVVFSLWAGKAVDLTRFLPKGAMVLYIVAAVLVVIGVVIGVPKIRHLIKQFLVPQAHKIGESLRQLMHNPLRLIVMVVGSAILTLSYIGALWASIQAFGGGLPIAGIAVVFLAGASIASAAPTPGGIGAVEAALVAGLSSLGLSTSVAVPAVFLYRLATFWIPVLPGWAGFTALQRRGDI